MDYVCKVEGDEEIDDNAEGVGTVFRLPGWHLTILLQADSAKGTLSTTATEVVNPKTRYNAGAEHFGDVKVRSMSFIDFELGKANDFLYPRAWNNASIRIDFNGTDGSIFATTFVMDVGAESVPEPHARGAGGDDLTFDNRSLCHFDFRDFSEKVNLDPAKLDIDTSDSSTEYLVFLPAQFDVELTVKGIVVGKTSGFIYQIRDENPFRRGNEKTGAFFPVMKTGGDLFPDIELKPDIPVDVVATVGYPSLTITTLIGFLCMALVVWIILKRIAGNKGPSV
jgi:hypothetical protein